MTHILNDEDYEKIIELLEEIDGIVISADSPDAREIIEDEPKEACKFMMLDLSRISGLIDLIRQTLQ